MKNLSKVFLLSLLFYGNCVTANAQVSNINSTVIIPRVFNDDPGATGNYVNNYPGSITLGETGMSSSSGFANRDVWYFSNNGGVSAYQFQNGDYFNASFTIILTGNNPNGKDLEAGWIFSNPSGTWGGDLQSILIGNNGVVVQFGGPSYYPFSPAAGGYPGAGGSVPNYTLGQIYTFGLNYVLDPNTGRNAFQYSVNGQYAASAPGNPYFDLGPGVSIGSPGDHLGGYFEIQNDPNNPNQAGQAVFQNISISPPLTINLDGTLDSAYGNPLAVQTVNTGFGNAAGGADSAGGSELDAAYGRISGGNLYLFLAGNVENNGNHLNVFIAGGAPGQNVLTVPNTGTMQAMNGSVFSAGFQATFALDVNDYSGTLYSEEYNLIANTGGYVGALGNSGTGIYAGRDGGVTSIYLNNNNASTMGAAGAASTGGGASTTTGYELVIPLSAIGYGGGNIEVLADVNGGGDGYLANQFLPGLAVGTGNVGGGGLYSGPSSGAFNFGSTPGQYFVVSVSNQSPSILSQPASQKVPVGSNVIFSVTTFGSTPLFYQWQFNGTSLSNATYRSLLLTNAQFANAGGYSLIVTNAYGSYRTAVAQLTVYTNLAVVQTSQTPPPPGNPTIPTDATHFRVFTNSYFTNGIGLDPNKSTIVITHGWKDTSTIWPLEIANDIKLVLGASTPNIVAWDWKAEANDTLASATYKTLGQGSALGTDLVAALGSNYSMRIHFMGHSLGTMVNAAAANYVHGHGFSPANTQMTLFDEASAASGLLVDSWQTATTLLQNDANPNLTLQPVLPNQFAWADNYITAFGLLHPNAVNVILTNLYPVIDNSVFGDIKNTAEAIAYLENQVWPGFIADDTIYHHYPHVWYFNTINQINNPNDPPYLMGFVRSWEGGGYYNRPAANTYYIESGNCPPSFLNYSGYDPAYNLVQTNSDQASQFLNNRLNTILPKIFVSAVSASQNVSANAPNQVHAMLASGQILNPVADEVLLLQNGAAAFVQFNTTELLNNLIVKGAAQPQGGPVPNGTGNGSPAYVWITLSVPSNAVEMSFDFMLQGNGNQDSFQAALNNQNIFTLETVLIQTNVGMNSGLIDVSQYAGQQVQLFLGIVGGTSTNATVMVGNILFYSAALPTLQIQMAGTNAVLSWPLWAANYSLETTPALGTTNSWTVVTNAPSIVNSQCTVTNQISSGSEFYRLAIVTAPALQAQVSGNNIILSWPTSAQNFSLQTTTNLADPNSWMTLTNVAAIVNLQDTITNPITRNWGYYRLIQSQ